VTSSVCLPVDVTHTHHTHITHTHTHIITHTSHTHTSPPPPGHALQEACFPQGENKQSTLSGDTSSVRADGERAARLPLFSSPSRLPLFSSPSLLFSFSSPSRLPLISLSSPSLLVSLFSSPCDCVNSRSSLCDYRCLHVQQHEHMSDKRRHRLLPIRS